MEHCSETTKRLMRDLVTVYKVLAVIDIIKNVTLEPAVRKNEDGDDNFRLFVPIVKANAEKQEITGLVLQPEVVDAHSDVMSAEVIEKAAGDFLGSYNKSTTLGYMHKDFKPRFELRQSYVAPIDMAIGTQVVKAGTWIMVVKVHDGIVWKQIKDGKITGLSIGGKAKTQNLKV